MSENKTQSTAAATDVSELITDLDGGVFDRKLSIALSQVAASVVDNNRVGEVNIKLQFKRIPGTTQVHCEHTLKYTRPTLDGKASEKKPARLRCTLASSASCRWPPRTKWPCSTRLARPPTNPHSLNPATLKATNV